jgi:alpha-tubulin suppressor-like RCC1 family protein
LSSVSAISSGDSHSCALISDGTVNCWGANTAGQLGNGDTNSRLMPVAVSGLSSVAQIATGHAHSCALLVDRTVKCWGNNFSGQLGNGSSTNSSSSTPVAVSGLSSVAQIATGQSHSCALLVDGTVKCWGANASGQLGNGLSTNSSTPVAFSGGSSVSAISAGTANSCLLLLAGTVKCAGANASGQLGRGFFGNTAPTAYAVTDLSSVGQITTGQAHSCALLIAGTVRCWGEGSTGQLGNGSWSDLSTASTFVSGIQIRWNMNPTSIGKFLVARLTATNSSGSTTVWTPSVAIVQ